MPDEKILELFSVANALSLSALLVATLLSVTIYRRLADFVARKLPKWRFQILGSVPILRLIAWLLATLIAVFGVLKPPQESLIAVAASLGLALGLAIQDIVKNVLAGIVMIFQRPLTVGDMVSAGGHYGEVVGMDLMAIRLRTFDDSIVTIPNALACQEALLNSNSGSVHELVKVEFTVLGDVDVAQVTRLASEAAACSPYVFLKSPIFVIVEDRTERRRATRFTVKAYVIDVRLERAMATDVFTRITRTVALPDTLVMDVA
ncbi:MAG: mechanosensitive ion channel [Planctomycetes bacterium]|nr:mechanosensitive ion channel [Planctomycetota bacterium]